MIDPTLFPAACALVLATPGPTNTLLAAGGAAMGWRRSLPLVPAELAGYLLGIAAWGALLVPAMGALPWLGQLLRLACALYLVHCAAKLWNQGGAGLAGTRVVGPARLFAATLLNPKGFLFATTIFPAAAFAGPLPYAATAAAFAAVLCPIALAWIGAGAALAGHGSELRARRVRRAAALVLGGFALVVGAS